MTTTTGHDSIGSTQHEAALDAAAIQALITESLGATRQLPEQSRIAELDEQLRAGIDRLLPIATERAARLDRGTPEWHALQRAIDHTRDALLGSAGTGRLSGALHVAELARQVCGLQQAMGAEA